MVIFTFDGYTQGSGVIIIIVFLASKVDIFNKFQVLFLVFFTQGHLLIHKIHESEVFSLIAVGK